MSACKIINIAADDNNEPRLLVSIQQLVLLLLIQRLHVVAETLPHRVPVLLCALLLDPAFMGEEDLDEVLRRDGGGPQSNSDCPPSTEVAVAANDSTS